MGLKKELSKGVEQPRVISDGRCGELWADGKRIRV